MDADDKTLNLFTTRMRQLILQYREMVRENGELCRTVEEKDRQIGRLEAELAERRRDYESLKMAKMLEVTDGDIETAKSKISKVIRDIDKCITLLNEK